MATVKSSPPGGLAIKRNDQSFNCSWKIPSGGYGSGQEFQWRTSNCVSSGKPYWYHAPKSGDSTDPMHGTNKDLNPAATGINIPLLRKYFYPTAKYKASVDTSVNSGKTYYTKSGDTYSKVANPTGNPSTSSYYEKIKSSDLPKTKYFEFRIQGTRKSDAKNKYTVSDFATKRFDIKTPRAPVITKTVSTWPTVKFAWKVTSAKDDAYYITDVEYESILLKDSSITDGSKITSWTYSNKEAVPGSRLTKTVPYPTCLDSSVTPKEDSSILADGTTYTRWIRIRSRGFNGNSAWRYAKHIYAIPKECKIDDKSTVAPDAEAMGYLVKLWFSTPMDTAKYPMENAKVQYAITVPEENLSCPDSASWTGDVTVLPKDQTSGAILSIDSLLNLDQCLFCRANSYYDNRTTYGTPKMLDSGNLKAPTNFSIDPDETNYRITVHAENKSDVPDSYIAIRWYNNNRPEGYDLGIIPRGLSETIIQAPEWAPETSPSIGVRAVVGDYEVSDSDYMYTEDTSYVFGKRYYTRTGDGDVNSPYEYSKFKVPNPSATNDATSGGTRIFSASEWIYEKVNNQLVLTEDNVPQNKTYYKDGYYRVCTNPVSTSLSWPILTIMSSESSREAAPYQLAKFESMSYFWSIFNEYYPKASELNPVVRLFVLDDGNNLIDAIYVRYNHDRYEKIEEEDGSYSYKFRAFNGGYITLTADEILEKVVYLTRYPDNKTGGIIKTDLRCVYTNDNYTEDTEFDWFKTNSDPSALNPPLFEANPLGISIYQINALMESVTVREGGEIPMAPYNVTAERTDIPGTIRVTWEWSDSTATKAELSWADHKDAWESTDEPSTYTISRLRNGAWNISGLTTGIEWYIRVRLISGTEDATIYGEYSKILTVNLASAPSVPTLQTIPENGVITKDGDVTLSWIYSTNDGTSQSNAKIYEVFTDSETGTQEYREYAEVQTQQDFTINALTARKLDDEDPNATGWDVGETHLFAVVVVSESGQKSDDYSNIVKVTVAEPVEFEIDTENLEGFEEVDVETIDSTGEPETITEYSLVTIPFTIAVTGVDDDEKMSVSILRADDYHVFRPDESDFYGFNEETVVQKDTQDGGEPVTIDISDLIGNLDDGAKYKVEVTVKDNLGQSDRKELPFVVHWQHQPVKPSVTVTIDEEEAIAIMTPTIDPNDYEEGDVCDIYRLSVDKPVLIYSGAEFGTSYVDPYPTIGEYGGHRFVMRTKNGDYIMGDDPNGAPAWIDTGEEDGDRFDSHANIIDFDKGRAYVLYEVDMSNSWSKDFKETKYLGGHVQGDWNKAVSRTGSISVTTVSDYDQETIQTMRRLAEHPGICHVRSKDGSSYFADIEINETYEYTRAPRFNKYDLSITRIDSEMLEGMSLEDWNRTHSEESE